MDGEAERGGGYNEGMDEPAIDYDERYLAGIVLFNRGDFFEAHEVWEDLWQDSARPEKRFYQGLIQAAVALCHYANGNLRGAAKLYASSRAYMEPLALSYLGMDTHAFWRDMAQCFAPVLAADRPDRHAIRLEDVPLPAIALDPAPATWPDADAFLKPDD